MAKLLCINEETYREEINNIGDIVAIYPDDKTPVEEEQTGFNIVEVEGSVESIQAELQALLPENPNRSIPVKYEFKVVDPFADSIANMCSCNVPSLGG